MKPLLHTITHWMSLNWVTRIGAVLTTASAFAFVGLLFQPLQNPYSGIIVFLALPALFVLGLLMMPVGLYIAGRKSGGLRGALSAEAASGPRTAVLLLVFGLATLANVTIIGAAAYSSVAYMDSAKFCGLTCHTVMEPHYIRYQLSPHARVECVNCHVGPGAASFIRYKLVGAHQAIDLMTNHYPRPIPPATTQLRPAQQTCEFCHAPNSQENRLRIIRHYEDDEKSTEKTTVLFMKVAAIHKAHAGSNIQYVSTTPDLQKIPLVTAGGKTYSTGAVDANGVRRTMDCMDCHNRPAHDFLMPEEAVDRAIAEGRLDRNRPFARREAVLALKAGTALEQQPAAVREIYSRNVFPQMKITWGSYPNNLGHERFPGCFRCHDGEHNAGPEASISQDCSTCHELVAVDEQNPGILKELGLVQ